MNLKMMPGIVKDNYKIDDDADIVINASLWTLGMENQHFNSDNVNRKNDFYKWLLNEKARRIVSMIRQVVFSYRTRTSQI